MSSLPSAETTTRDRWTQLATAGAQADSLRILNFPAWLYHAELERQSCSMLKPLLLSPAHYRAQFFQRRTSSPAMSFGTLVHTLVLEPHLLHQQYLVIPEGLRPSSKDGRQLAASHPGRELISEFDMYQARSLAQQILDKPYKGRPFGRYVEEGVPEVTFFYSDPVTGVPCRARLDLWHPDFLFDLKTTRHSGGGRFTQAAVDLHYDFQAYMYCLADATHEGRGAARPFVFIGANNSPPFGVAAMAAGTSFIENGRAKYQRALSLYRACADLNYWPHENEDTELEISPWQAYRPCVGAA